MKAHTKFRILSVLLEERVGKGGGGRGGFHGFFPLRANSISLGFQHDILDECDLCFEFLIDGKPLIFLFHEHHFDYQLLDDDRERCGSDEIHSNSEDT